MSGDADDGGLSSPKRGPATAAFMGRMRESGTYSPTAPRGSANKAQAAEYLRKHSVPQLLEDLTSDLAINQPLDPVRHLHKRLGLMIGAEEASDGVVPADSSCYLRVHIECSTRRVDGMVTHFLRKSTIDAGTSEMIRGWLAEALLQLEGIVSEALGEPMAIDITGSNEDAPGTGEDEVSNELDTLRQELEDTRASLERCKSTIEAQSEALKRLPTAANQNLSPDSSPRKRQKSPDGRKGRKESGVITRRPSHASRSSEDQLQADIKWDKPVGKGQCRLRIIVSPYTVCLPLCFCCLTGPLLHAGCQ